MKISLQITFYIMSIWLFVSFKFFKKNSLIPIDILGNE